MRTRSGRARAAVDAARWGHERGGRARALDDQVPIGVEPEHAAGVDGDRDTFSVATLFESMMSRLPSQEARDVTGISGCPGGLGDRFRLAEPSSR